MITLLLACAAGPTLTVTCSDVTGAEVFRAECPADAVQITRFRSGSGVRATCTPWGGLWPAKFIVDADVCRALPEVDDGR